MSKLTDAQRAFIRENTFCAVITTLREDGSPHSTVVWVDEADGDLIMNTALERKKGENLKHDPRASVIVVDPGNPYKWVSIDGTATLTTEGANEVINHLSHKYVGQDFQPNPNHTRVTITVTPTRVTASGFE